MVYENGKKSLKSFLKSKINIFTEHKHNEARTKSKVGEQGWNSWFA